MTFILLEVIMTNQALVLTLGVTNFSLTFLLGSGGPVGEGVSQE